MVLVNEAAGTFEVVSYGSTRRECAEAKGLADEVYRTVADYYCEPVEAPPP
jgi:hypothetical protein